MLTTVERIRAALERLLECRAEIASLEREPTEEGDWVDTVQTARYRLDSTTELLLKAYGQAILAEHLTGKATSVA
jgi:hypothetical protein